MNFNWNKEKDKKLKQIRGVSFAEIMELGKIINVEDNPNYPYQKRFIILYKNYIYSIPFVKSNKEIFLKTIIPSRKLKRKYLGDNRNG